MLASIGEYLFQSCSGGLRSIGMAMEVRNTDIYRRRQSQQGYGGAQMLTSTGDVMPLPSCLAAPSPIQVSISSVHHGLAPLLQ